MDKSEFASETENATATTAPPVSWTRNRRASWVRSFRSHSSNSPFGVTPARRSPLPKAMALTSSSPARKSVNGKPVDNCQTPGPFSVEFKATRSPAVSMATAFTGPPTPFSTLVPQSDTFKTATQLLSTSALLSATTTMLSPVAESRKPVIDPAAIGHDRRVWPDSHEPTSTPAEPATATVDPSLDMATMPPVPTA